MKANERVSDALDRTVGKHGGRDGDWQGALVRLAAPEALDALTAVGFTGLMIDRAGYTDHGARIEAEYTRTLGREPRVSPNGRLVFYDLRPWARDLHARLTAAQIDALRRTTLAARAPPPGALTP